MKQPSNRQHPPIRESADLYQGIGMSSVKRNARYRRNASITGALLCAVVFLTVILVALIVISQSGWLQKPEDTLAGTATGQIVYPYETISDAPPTTEYVIKPTELSFVGPPVLLTEPIFVTATVSNEAIARGDLILVNHEHAYQFPDGEKQTVFYGNKSPAYTLNGISLSIDSDLFPLFDKMLVDFSEATGCKEVLITSGYRSYEDQQAIMASRITSMGEEKAKMYVAEPGHSEHHSGLAVDMVIFTGGRQYYFPEHENGAWIIENAPDYGFILRYTEEMAELTGCAAEPWHYRYVGTPHARLITDMGLCYEQYVEYLYGFTWGGNRFYIAEDGTTSTGDGFTLPEDGYMVYYVPAADGTETEIPLPPGYENYEISGDNVNGFFVTVALS